MARVGSFPPATRFLLGIGVAGSITAATFDLSPEVLAAVAGALLVWAIFAALAGKALVSGAGNTAWLNASAPLGILAVAVGIWLLRRTVVGNWIFATGGDAETARNTEAPVTRVKVARFADTALAACLVAVVVVVVVVDGARNGVPSRDLPLPRFGATATLSASPQSSPPTELA
jgi:predicted ABC-type sugar transport system permease subunit